MRFVDEFRDADKAHALAAKIAGLCEPAAVQADGGAAGTPTRSTSTAGGLLPEQITLVHGPGCPSA